MKNTLNLCLFLLMSLLLWSCDDGSQTYTRLRVESEYFDVAKIVSKDAADAVSKHKVEQKTCDFGYVAKYGDDVTIYRLKRVRNLRYTKTRTGTGAMDSPPICL